jgi:hypothetical protein
MRVARWSISRRGSRLEVDLDDEAELSSSELDALCEAVEPELREGVREVVLEGEATRQRVGTIEFLDTIRRIGRLALRHGKSFSVRPI